MTLAIDTLAIARKLQAAGFSEDQAEAVTTVIRDSRDADLSVLATKSDIAALNADIQGLRKESKADLGQTELRLTTDLRETELRLTSDLRETELRLKADLRETELRLEAKIETAKSDIIKWVFGAIGSQTVVIVGAAITIARLFVK